MHKQIDRRMDESTDDDAICNSKKYLKKSHDHCFGVLVVFSMKARI